MSFHTPSGTLTPKVEMKTMGLTILSLANSVARVSAALAKRYVDPYSVKMIFREGDERKRIGCLMEQRVSFVSPRRSGWRVAACSTIALFNDSK